MTNVSRIQPPRRVTKCGEGRADGWGCGIPLTLPWVDAESGLCAQCVSFKASADASERVVRGPDGKA